MQIPHPPPPLFRAAAIGVLATALLAPAAFAADKKAATPPATSKTAVLTPAQLRDCMTQKDKLAKDTDAALKAKAEMAAAKTEIDSTGTALAEQGTTLDRTNADAVTTYNAKVLERNDRIDAYQAQVAAYNTSAESILTAKEAYEKACANRRYDDRDLSDIQRKK
jgi:L-lactate utilization protein LutC